MNINIKKHKKQQSIYKQLQVTFICVLFEIILFPSNFKLIQHFEFIKKSIPKF